MVDFIGRGTSTECDLLGHGKEIVDATIQHQTPTSLIGIGAVDLYRFIPNRLDAEFRLPNFTKVDLSRALIRRKVCTPSLSQMGTTSESSGQT